jgi:RND superfamily putative drug exporter
MRKAKMINTEKPRLFVLRHKGLIIMVWLILAVLGAVLSLRLPSKLDYTYSTPGQPGYEANLHIEKRFRIDPAFEPAIVVLKLPPGQTMSARAGQKMAAENFNAATKAGAVIVTDYASTHDPKFILDQGRSTWALISLPNPDYGIGKDLGWRVAARVREAVPAGGDLVITGFEKLLTDDSGGDPNVLLEVVIGALFALAIILLTYGSAIAILPVILAFPTVLATYFLVFGMACITSVSYFVPILVLLLGFGIAIDYSLILIVRWREETETGLSNDEAIRAAVKSAGRAIVLSGVTVAVGLFSLVILPVPYLRSVGYGSMLLPVVATFSAITILPVCLSLFGPALDKYRFISGSVTFSNTWEKWARFLLRHRVAALLSGLLVLVLLAIPGMEINTAEPDISSLSGTGAARKAFLQLVNSGIPSAVDFPVYIMVHGSNADVQAAQKLALATKGVYAVFAPGDTAFRKGNDALLVVIPAAEGSTPDGRNVVRDLRQRVQLPGAKTYIGGSTAADMSFTKAVYGNFPLMITLISLITLLILTIVLRSVVLALKAVVLNLFSLGAVFGFMVLFWQKGYGSGLVYGFLPAGAIRDWIPSVIFACLFGLSMDYEVFVLVRIREEYDRTGSTDEAIVQGLARTGRLVSCAAIILMISFLSLSGGPNQINKIIATTLAFGVLADAILIRTVLVPSLISLMGRANWWMPEWAKRTKKN